MSKRFGLTALLAAAIAATAAATLPAAAKPPMEAFGDVPAVRSPNLSPDGKTMVFLSRIGDSDYLTIYDFATGESQPLASTTSIRARHAYFAGPDHVVLIASDERRMEHFIGTSERSAAFAYNLKTKKIVQLLAATDGIYPGQSAFGVVLAIDPDGKHVYMPAYMGPGWQRTELRRTQGQSRHRQVGARRHDPRRKEHDWLARDLHRPTDRQIRLQ